MLTDIGYGLVALVGLGITIVGARFLLAPRAAAAGYGIAVEPGAPGAAYLTVKGVRDIAWGPVIFVLLLLAHGEPHLIGWFILAATINPIGDALTVLYNRGPRATAYGVHGGTAVVMLAAAALLLV